MSFRTSSEYESDWDDGDDDDSPGGDDLGDFPTGSDEDSFDALPMMFCPECRRGVTEDTQKCPHCGEWITPVDRPPGRWSTKRIVFVAAVLLMLFAMLRFAL